MTAQSQTRPSAWKFEPVSIEGKRALVTGGTTGIGRTTALLLARLGAKVLIFSRGEQNLQDALKDLDEVRDNVIGLTADAASEDDLDVVFAAVDEKLGGLDILVNNHGLPAGGVTDSDAPEYRYVVETNLLGYLACAKRAIERMRNNSGKPKGTIVNIGSMSAKSRGPGSDVYVATKAGIRGWSEALAKQVQEQEIRVSLIEPGKIGADFRDDPNEKEQQQHEEGTLLFSESIAESVLSILTQPAHTHIPFVQVEPLHNQAG